MSEQRQPSPDPDQLASELALLRGEVDALAVLPARVEALEDLGSGDAISRASLPTVGAALPANDPRIKRSLARGASVVADRSNCYTSAAGLSNGVVTSGTGKVRHRACITAAGLRLVYGNFNYLTNKGPSKIKVKASVEVGGLKYPVWFGGKRTVELEPGAVVISDVIGVAVTATTFFYTLTFVSVVEAEGTKKWPQDLLTVAGNGEGNTYATPGTDVTDEGAIEARSAAVYSPMMILGDGIQSVAPTVALIGDSIMHGWNDSSLDRGFAARALDQTIGLIRLACPNQKASEAGPAADQNLWTPLLAAATGAIEEYGINDLFAERSVAQIQANKIQLWLACAQRSIPVWVTTITPKTKSTDGWVTVENQTTLAFEGRRIELNQWLRDGAPVNAANEPQPTGSHEAGTVRIGELGHPCSGGGALTSGGIFETAYPVESANNSGKWVPALVTKTEEYGVHPNQAGHEAMAAAVTPASFNVL